MALADGLALADGELAEPALPELAPELAAHPATDTAISSKEK
jgi:hypothetical protein